MEEELGTLDPPVAEGVEEVDTEAWLDVQVLRGSDRPYIIISIGDVTWRTSRRISATRFIDMEAQQTVERLSLIIGRLTGNGLACIGRSILDQAESDVGIGGVPLQPLGLADGVILLRRQVWARGVDEGKLRVLDPLASSWTTPQRTEDHEKEGHMGGEGPRESTHLWESNV